MLQAQGESSSAGPNSIANQEEDAAAIAVMRPEESKRDHQMAQTQATQIVVNSTRTTVSGLHNSTNFQSDAVGGNSNLLQSQPLLTRTMHYCV